MEGGITLKEQKCFKVACSERMHTSATGKLCALFLHFSLGQQIQTVWLEKGTLGCFQMKDVILIEKAIFQSLVSYVSLLTSLAASGQ